MTKSAVTTDLVTFTEYILNKELHFLSSVMLLEQSLEELKNKKNMLENKVFCQEVELSELKDIRIKKVNSCNFEKENLETECNNRDNLSKVYLKLKNELEIASKEL